MSPLVYSTDAGRICPNCSRPVAACACAKKPARPAGDGVVRVQLETKGRAGKGVTVVRGLDLPDADLVVLGKQLKSACGSGGTVKDGVIEVQGDHVVKIMSQLTNKGYRVKRVGG